MTVDDAKVAKAALEQSIAYALRQFTADTGLTVSSVWVERIPGSYRVEVEAQL